MADRRPALFAPTIDQVDIVVDGRESATCSEEEGWWRSPIELAAGTRYRFRLRSRSWFQDGATVEVPDPEAEAVSDDAQWSVVADGSLEEYSWRYDDRALPAREQLIIYELWVQEFNNPGDGGGFGDVVDRIDHLADLGVTAIELMPVTHPGRDEGWGYTPRFYFALAPRYGDRADLARLVDEAHARSLRVVLDHVYNHADQDIPLAHIDHDCWFYHEPKDPDRAWGPQFNVAHRLPDDGRCPAREFLGRHLRHTIERYHIDGIRFDAVAQIDDDDFLAHLRDSAHDWAAAKPFACIAECAPVRPEIVGPDGVMDASWHHGFCEAVRDCLVGGWNEVRLRSAIDCREDGFRSGLDIVTYCSSHDTGHLLRFLLDGGLDEDAALVRSGLAHTLLLTTSGRPMLWMGDEFGADQAAEEGVGPLPWHLLDEDERRQGLHDHIRRLCHLRREHAALRGDACEILVCDGAQRALAYQRWDEAGGRFLIVAHPGDETISLAIPAPAPGRWLACLGEQAHEVGADDQTLHLEVEAWQAEIYRLDGG